MEGFISTYALKLRIWSFYMFHIHERFLRHIWRKQYLHTLELTIIDGRPLEIINPGIPNSDAGPDFLDAKIRIDGKTLRGDVELHNRNSDWKRHSHARDSRYNKVILHVVLYDDQALAPVTESGRAVPVLSLQRFLDDSFREVWDRSIADDRIERSIALPCTGLTDTISRDDSLRWLIHLSHERMELKLRRFEGRLKELIDERRLALREPKLRYYGDIDEIPVPNHEYIQNDFKPRWLWEQVLYEGIFEALGYSKNREPFLKLARNVRLDFLHERIAATQCNPVVILSAMLFGVAGLLPTDGSDDAMLSDIWRENEGFYRKERLQRAEWTFFRLRPNNFPTRRLAAGVILVQRLLDQDVIKKIVQILRSQITSREQISKLRMVIEVRKDEHTALLGNLRIDDIIVNTILPIALLYARVFKDPGIRETIQRVAAEYPSLAENTITRFIRMAVPGIDKSLHGALVQQGMIHLQNFYCTENRCSECAIGQKVFEKAAIKG
jgi:hypothetical protein